jgi:hypothetical protein
MTQYHQHVSARESGKKRKSADTLRSEFLIHQCTEACLILKSEALLAGLSPPSLTPVEIQLCMLLLGTRKRKPAFRMQCGNKNSSVSKNAVFTRDMTGEGGSSESFLASLPRGSRPLLKANDLGGVEVQPASHVTFGSLLISYFDTAHSVRLFTQPGFTSSTHIATTLFFSDLIYIYAAPIHHIPLTSRFIRDVKDNSLSTTEIFWHCVSGLCFTFLYSLITYTQTFYFLHYVPPTQWVKPLRASRTTPGIDSKWLGHPHFALSEAVHISLYVFA